MLEITFPEKPLEMKSHHTSSFFGATKTLSKG